MKKAKFCFIWITIFLFFSGCIAQEQEIHSFIFKGVELHFRADLNKAAKVPVFPDESSIPEIIFNEEIEKITIAIPDVTKAGYYAVAGYEIAYKLTFIYNSIYAPFSSPNVFEERNYTCLYYPDFEKKICIGKIIFDNYEKLKPSSKEVIIVLLGEGFTNTTEIVAEKEKNIILVKGKSFSMENRSYTDLDLASAKLLLALFSAIKNS